MTVRPPAVAGSFYPGARDALDSQLSQLLGAVKTPEGPCPKALIVPHAGYVYSGPIAATAFARVAPYGDRITRVVLIGPAHRVFVDGLVVARRVAARARRSARSRSTRRARELGVPRTRRRTRASTRSRSSCRSCSACVRTRKIVPLVRLARRRPRSSVRVLDAAVGRPRDADRDQLGSLALPAVREGPRDRRARPRERILALDTHARRRGRVRLDRHQRPCCGSRAQRPARRARRSAQLRRHRRHARRGRRLRRVRSLRGARERRTGRCSSLRARAAARGARRPTRRCARTAPWCDEQGAHVRDAALDRSGDLQGCIGYARARTARSSTTSRTTRSPPARAIRARSRACSTDLDKLARRALDPLAARADRVARPTSASAPTASCCHAAARARDVPAGHVGALRDARAVHGRAQAQGRAAARASLATSRS